MPSENEWWRDWLRQGIAQLGLGEIMPYASWRPGLFGNVQPQDLREVILDNHITFILGSLVGWRMVCDAARGRTGDEPFVLQSSAFLWLLYACFVYPRDSVLRTLTERLPNNTNENQLCRHLMSPNSAYRHIRNAIAHGNVEFASSGKTVCMQDNNWSAEFDNERLALDALLVVDLFASAFERMREL